MAEAGSAEVVHQPHLVGDADWLFLVLQAVARADFDQADLFGQAHMTSRVTVIAVVWVSVENRCASFPSYGVVFGA